MISPDKLRALPDDTAGLAYLILRDDDLGRDTPMPPLQLMFGPGRCTVRWRGKRFNLPLARIVGVELAATPIPAETLERVDSLCAEIIQAREARA